MKIYSSTNKPGLCFIANLGETLDPFTREAYAFHEGAPAPLYDVAESGNLAGFVWVSDYLNTVAINGNVNVYVPC